MQYVTLGNTGLQVSRLCLGTMSYGVKSWREWVLEEADSLPFYRRAWEAGINFFDSADMYSLGASEEILGRALKTLGIPRHRAVIATKVFQPMSDDVNDRGLSRKHIHHAVDASLRRLGTDYIDLYQIHRLDTTTPMEEILDALNELVRQGKVLYLGASSMYAWQFARMQYLADRMGARRFATMQNHYNLIYREEEREMLPLCRAEGVGVIPWSPLARGFLSGNRAAATVRSKTDAFSHQLYGQPSDFAVVDRLTEVAQARGASNAQVALAWLLSRPDVTSPIIGATKMAHLDEALSALELTLTADEIRLLEELYQPHPVLGH